MVALLQFWQQVTAPGIFLISTFLKLLAKLVKNEIILPK